MLPTDMKPLLYVKPVLLMMKTPPDAYIYIYDDTSTRSQVEDIRDLIN